MIYLARPGDARTRMRQTNGRLGARFVWRGGSVHDGMAPP